ncbi:hypothetical protein HMPREF1214_01898 [Bacteroides sp. HPS0048]|jgi:hypothetical protein|uniref:hypothetical protein n=1 Tax=Bacteroides sp. HPS0048 TaxID=1078089 RepID=UPI0003661AB7|nr:hypothetical protein [Bacteroides sp. HPS0048]EOA58782.1 hypothetical protein HMPREF1214_01898 [Bacteroides sp. HPS0048]
MQYGQIVFILFILMMCYYVALIVMDIRKEKAARAAEHDLHSEEDIDITDEAQSFQPVQVSRDETPKEPKGNEVGNSEGEAGEGDEPEQEPPTQDRIIYREAIMTDGILVEEIIHEVNKMAETGTSDLGAVIFSCEHAR